MTERKLDAVECIGAHHSILKQIKGLRLKKHRDAAGLYIAEGVKLVTEALQGSAEVRALLIAATRWDAYQPLRRLAHQRGLTPKPVSDRIFDALSDTQTPQGVLALLAIPKPSLAELTEKPDCFLTILDGVSDPGNVGTIVRTMDAAGGDGVILLPGCADPFGPKAVRATMGSILRIPVIVHEDAGALLCALAKTGFHIAASHLAGEDLYAWPGGRRKTALIVGSESHGVRAEVSAAAHSLIQIPMAGGTESLNAAVAAGIMIYEIFRKGRKMDE